MESDGFEDHTDVSSDLIVGQTYAIRLSPAFSNFEFNEWFHVWVDLDQNGAFDAPDELLFDSGVADNEPAQGSIQIPANTGVGTSRMRVIMQYSAAPGPPCSASFDYGEVEDYCITFATNTGMAVEEIPTSEGLLLYPQPASSQVTVRCAMGPGELTVLDATGRVVRNARMIGNAHLLETADLASGTYALLVTHRGGAVERGRLVVAHAR